MTMEHDLDAELHRLVHNEHTLSLHQPSRPSWLCRACHQPWPCPRRWSEMAAEFGSRLDLACYLVAWLGDAVNDHPDQQAQLHERFLSGLRTIHFTTGQPTMTVTTTLPARARAWSATAPEGDVLAEATRLAALHQVDADGRCLACPDQPSGGCRDGEWGRAALAALQIESPTDRWARPTASIGTPCPPPNPSPPRETEL